MVGAATRISRRISCVLLVLRGDRMTAPHRLDDAHFSTIPH